MGIYKISKELYDEPYIGQVLDVTLTPGRVIKDAQFAPGDPEIRGMESWVGEKFQPLGEPTEAQLKRTESGLVVYDSDRIPNGTKAMLRTIVFGGDSTGEFGYMYDESRVLETDNIVDPIIGEQIELFPRD